jgi:glycosyltransferase involved in cell wall biosynthesis
MDGGSTQGARPEAGWPLTSDPAFDAALLPPARQGVASLWYGHVPFGHWLVSAITPYAVVELGTSDGVSYAAFCEAVVQAALTTQCRAVLTAAADPTLAAFHDPRYGAFSRLERDAAAVTDVADASVDVLHIQAQDHSGLEATLAAWRTRLSDRLVLLLSPSAADDATAAKLRAAHPTFTFTHAGGLLVVAMGRDVPAPVAALCGLTDPVAIAACAARFATLGERWELDWQRPALPGEEPRALELQRLLVRRGVELQRAQAARLRAERDARLAAARATNALYERDLVMNSTFWRLTYPARLLVGRAPQLRPATLLRDLLAAARRLARRRPAALPGASAADAPGAPPPGAARIVFVSGEPRTPGHTYRVVRQAAAAVAAGASVVTMDVHDMAGRLDELAGASLLVVWRAEWSIGLAQLYATARRHAIPVAFDLDDLILKPELARVEVIDGIRSQDFAESTLATMFTNIAIAVEEADLCIATTDEIAYAMRACQKPTVAIPNGFDDAAVALARQAVRARAAQAPDGLVRIGYAGGSRTHQRDFALAAGALARLLASRPHCRLVLYRTAAEQIPLLDIEEYPELLVSLHQIEWRDTVPAAELSAEIARFDINLAPVEVGNPFCEAKSELKYFEAALAGVCTIASPTGPFARAIRPGETGLLARTPEEWFDALCRLVDDAPFRRRLGQAAFHAVLYPYGQQLRADRVWSLLRQIEGGRAAGRAFALDIRPLPPAPAPDLPETEVLFAVDRLGTAQVTVVIPVFNYEHYVTEALDSVAAQTLALLDLVVVDDRSTDGSLGVALAWAERHAARFNRLLVLRNLVNAGLGPARNAGFAAAETPYVLPLDADNRLLPECCAGCLAAMDGSGAAFAYPRIQCFGLSEDVIGAAPFLAMRLVGGNYIDAMALVAKWAWAAGGGYRAQRLGWEDYEFWCRLVSRGMWGVAVPVVLAEYRVHGESMLHRTTEQGQNRRRLASEMQQLHTWLSIPLKDVSVEDAHAPYRDESDPV